MIWLGEGLVGLTLMKEELKVGKIRTFQMKSSHRLVQVRESCITLNCRIVIENTRFHLTLLGTMILKNWTMLLV